MYRSFALGALALFSASLVSSANALQDPADASARTQSSPPSISQPSASTSTKPKQKKVWTNENLADADGPISIVGDPRSASKPEGKSAGPRSGDKSFSKSIDPRVIANFRQQLQKLQAQLAVTDQQLSDLKDFSKGNSKHTGGLQQDTWQYNMSSVDEQIRNLQDRKTKIQASIDSLLDLARKNGIEPGQLR